MLFSKRKENLPTAGGRVEPDQWDIGRCSIIIEARNAIAPLLLGSTGTFQRRGGSVRTICDGNTTRLPADVRFRCDSLDRWTLAHLDVRYVPIGEIPAT